MISVIMPVYNVEDYVAEAIESVRQQSYGEWELLLIDDGSTDESSKICKAYAEKEEKIRYIRKENGGVSSARNRGLQETAGEWIYFMDADDWLDRSDRILKKFFFPACIIRLCPVPIDSLISHITVLR